MDEVLDTPAKRTLWFHLIPLLDEDDQEYCKRKLYLPTLISRRQFNSNSALQMASNFVGTNVASNNNNNKNTLQKYYYDDNNKNELNNDDFILTDREIDNLFDLTHHLPENNG